MRMMNVISKELERCIIKVVKVINCGDAFSCKLDTGGMRNGNLGIILKEISSLIVGKGNLSQSQKCLYLVANGKK